MTTNEQKAIGRVISKIECRPGGNSFCIHTDKGPINGFVDADCCSNSWVDSIELPCDDINGAIILSIESPEERDCNRSGCKNPPEYTDFIRAYQTLIRTSKGTIAIEYRNSSNGYYGGSLQLTVP